MLRTNVLRVCILLAALLVAGSVFLAIAREPLTHQVDSNPNSAGQPRDFDRHQIPPARSEADRTLVDVDEGQPPEENDPRPFTGTRETHWPDGTLRESGEWVDGKRVGIHRNWRQNGQLASEVFWDRDRGRQGTARFYHENGRLFIDGYYSNGMRDGTWTEYHADGTLSSQGAYVQRISTDGRIDAKRDGYWEFRDVLGRVEERSGIYQFGVK